MQFKIGDRVVHPIHGTGQIVNIEKKQFSGKTARLYYEVALPKLITLWVPIEAQKASGLRLVTPQNDLDYYRNLLKSPSVPLTTDYHQRHLELVSRLKPGSFQAMCEVVRDLTASGWQKRLGVTDTTILQKTRQSLYQEWAAAASVSLTEAIKEIDTLLLTTRPI
jgi:CarD family transcriptional regulator